MGPFLPSPPKPLPKELDQFMQEAGDKGVILVSFGTVLEEVDEKLLQLMAKAFSKLPQKILWKLKGMSTKTGRAKMTIENALCTLRLTETQLRLSILGFKVTFFTAFLWHSIFELI